MIRLSQSPEHIDAMFMPPFYMPELLTKFDFQQAFFDTEYFLQALIKADRDKVCMYDSNPAVFKHTTAQYHTYEYLLKLLRNTLVEEQL